MGLNSTSVRKKRRLWMNCMWFFNTFLGLVALIVSGLIGATITFLLMSLGMPNKPVSYRWKDSKESDLRRIEEIMDENRRFR